MAEFRYDEAFSRNLGWVTASEQHRLRQARVALAGMGGVGGVHLQTLARLGVGHFHIADLDTFELANFNRQAGALVSTLGQSKVEVLRRQVLDINPEAEVTVFARGIHPDNLDDFLRRVDVYVDGLDFFAFGARRAVFSACQELEIPAVTAAPLGMGAALLDFLPGSMGFEDYFGLEGCDEAEQALRLLVGLAPGMLHRTYLADRSRVDLRGRRGPSTVMACQLCAGLAATEVLKIVLGRGPLRPAPHGLQVDAYRGRTVHTWRPGGHRHPLTRLALALARRQLRG
ncbi:ThiF family adenylyltransferase [Ideonella livida]|uniref:ThiF family adenylyltransferase n=1 Tax=Ideonella livida TaxID=2707176 RepID=A0A7C9TNN2_9BURK|nr:ThiF family adenylyltransferase [Ideonella livida]NDY93427.1 ThiF family adenylyltransferase [Ideonella livida]